VHALWLVGKLLKHAHAAWLDPPAGVEITRAVEIAERQVMGVKTDPEFDRNELQPLVSAYNSARKAGATPSELRRRATAIEGKLSPLVSEIYGAVQRSLSYLRDFPPAAILAELARIEREEFLNFMDARDRDMPLPYRDSPKAGAFKITARETAASNLDQGALYGDAMALARARIDGTVLAGVLTNHTQTKVSRTTIHRFDVRTTQTNLHLRTGDELALVIDPRLHCEVEGVDRSGATAIVSFRVTKGMRTPGVPIDGTAVDIAPPPPDWSQIWRNRAQMSKRLRVTPWTHRPDDPPARQAGPSMVRPNDLIFALERFK
jgi:hypothetical protein